VSRPLSIDLFCGLSQAEFFLAANPFVEQLVAGWAKHPKHVPLHIRYRAPGSVSLVLRSMSELNDPRLATRFARSWQIWKPAAHPRNDRILALPLGLVKGAALFVFSARPYLAQLARGFNRTFSRAISLIGAWRNDREVCAASAAQSALLSRSLMLVSAHPASALRAVISTPFLVWTNGLKGLGAERALQVVHGNIMS
jgi:hypothetical protein